MPIFQYEHPETGEIFEEIRTFKNYHDPLILEDGTKCERVLFPKPTKGTKGPAIINKNREVFQADTDYVKRSQPKYIKFNDGHRERYDPTKHC